ncbi:MAG: methyltransferase domain-containing protein [Terracidiphilus sp.]|jgi:SAM-dependent methyltransferase
MATLTAPTTQKEQMAGSRWLLLTIFLAAFIVRLSVVCFVYRDLPYTEEYMSHPQFGWEMGWVARALASGHGFSSPFFPASGPTAMVSPLYTVLLSGVFRLFGIYSLTSAFVILSINSFFSSLTCIPVYFSAKYSLGLRGAKLAAYAWAFYPFAIYFSAGRVWEYSLTSLLFTCCFCIIQRIHNASTWVAWLGFGLLYGITANSNPAVLSCLPFLLIFALWKVRKSGGHWFLYGVITAVGVLAALAPWTIRNYRVLHVLVPIRDNYWSNVYAGNIQDNLPNRYPFWRANEPNGNPAEMQKFLTKGEVAYFAERHDLAVDFIRHNPLPVAIASLRRVVMYWTGYWSFSHDYLQDEPTELPLMFLLVCVTGLMLRGVRRLWRENRSGGMPYFILIAVFPLSYYFTLALMDYRQPIEPAIIVLVIAGLFPFRNTQPRAKTVGDSSIRTVFLRDVSRQSVDSDDRKCPLCAGKLVGGLHKAEDSSGGGSFDVLRCDSCGLGKTDPMPSDLAPYYANYHGGRHGVTARHCVKRRMSIVDSSTHKQKPGTLLDFGCGDGTFLLAAQKRGWTVQGTELSPHAARQRGLDVVTEIREIPDTTVFDCVTLWHSLEHLSDPMSALRSIRSHLSPTGILLIAVPDIDGIQAKLFGRRWYHLDVPRHLYHYSSSSLSALLQSTGFSPVQRWHQEFEYDLIGWPQSALNCLLPTSNVFIDLLMGRSPQCSGIEKLTSCISGAVLTGLAIPLVAMGSLTSRGATVIVAARPLGSQRDATERAMV